MIMMKLGCVGRYILPAIILSALIAGGRVFADEEAEIREYTVQLEAGELLLETVSSRIGLKKEEIEWVSPRLEGFGNAALPGTPALPGRVFLVALPPGAEVLDVTRDWTETEIIDLGDLMVKPAGMMVSGTGKEAGKFVDSPRPLLDIQHVMANKGAFLALRVPISG